jgi:hypothetical protein
VQTIVTPATSPLKPFPEYTAHIHTYTPLPPTSAQTTWASLIMADTSGSDSDSGSGSSDDEEGGGKHRKRTRQNEVCGMTYLHGVLLGVVLLVFIFYEEMGVAAGEVRTRSSCYS